MTAATTLSQNTSQTARVVRLDGDYVWVRAHSTSACGSCESKGACGSLDLLGPLLRGRQTESGSEVRLRNLLNAQIGDDVSFDMPANRLLYGTVFAYLVPLIALFGGALLGRMLGSEGLSAFFGLGGLLSALYLNKRWMNSANASERFSPIMLNRNEQTVLFTSHPDKGMSEDLSSSDSGNTRPGGQIH